MWSRWAPCIFTARIICRIYCDNGRHREAFTRFILHAYEHDANATHFSEEAVQKLGLSADHIYKTLLVCLNGGKRGLDIELAPADLQKSLDALVCRYRQTRG